MVIRGLKELGLMACTVFGLLSIIASGGEGEGTDQQLPAPPTSIIRVSVDSAGIEGNSDASYPSISADGRYVAFESMATNLVAGDTNNFWDVFVHDTQTGLTTRVSIDSAGTQGNSASYQTSISADGRYVAFASIATNLVADDTNNTEDVFVHDTQSGLTTRVSVDSASTEGNNISDDPSISADGRYVAFASRASNLVAGDTNNTWDVFVHDTQTGITTRVSVDSASTEGNNISDDPSISADGRYVAFRSIADNLVADDTNASEDIFVHDTQTRVTTRVSVDSSGIESNFFTSTNPFISADGRYVAFESDASNLVADDTNNFNDVFVHDTQTGITARVSVDSDGTEGNYVSGVPSISGDGRYVAFGSLASNLVADDTNNAGDMFVHDTQTGITTRVSVDSASIQSNAVSSFPSISGDGRYVAFGSLASNLVADDTNNTWDVFRALNQ
jgi:Tol biopolymer transport system component